MNVKNLDRRTATQWVLAKKDDMRVPGVIFATESLIRKMDDKVSTQIENVACLPGIVRASLAMPVCHWGYGFPIGGVGAFDENEGVLCMGGVGFDISCGVRAINTDITTEELKGQEERLADLLFKTVPAGLGSTGEIKLDMKGIDDVLMGGGIWAVEKGYGTKEDLDHVEEFGRIDGADPSKVSQEAKKRQYQQVGTLGSGNHYLEVQKVEEVFDEAAAKGLGLRQGGIVVAIHCGSRALGHQIGTDYLKVLERASKTYNIPLRDRELACAPTTSREGQDYLAAMRAGINCALANRQVIGHLTRKAFGQVFPSAKLTTLYDISHNTCKLEEHEVDGEKRRLFVHRKGATRALGPGRPELPKDYMDLGQPVLIGGTMGTCSYIMLGTKEGTKETFGSACHGAGRAMGRNEAMRRWRGEAIQKMMRTKGIVLKAHSMAGVAEEAPDAYKDVTEVVDAVHAAGLARKVVMLKPLIVVKG